MDAMDVFGILLMNLNHPSRTIRLRTAQEMSKLLQSPNIDLYKQRYLDALKSCELEMDTCTLLVPLCQKDGKPNILYHEIKANISAPSILADQMLSSLYSKQTPFISWATCHSGIVPKNFEKPKIFEKLEATEPGVYRGSIAWLEEHFGVPLVLQLYSEWNYLWKKFKGRPFNHRNLSDISNRNGVHGEVESRASEILKSAFLRTLAIAYSEYNIPLAALSCLSVYAAPVNFDYFQIEPQNPSKFWPKPTGKKAKSYNKTWLQSVSKTLQADKEYLPLAGKGIVYEDEAFRIELAFHAVAIEAQSEISICELFENDSHGSYNASGDPLRLPEEFKVSSIALRPNGISNFGIFPAALCCCPPNYPRWQSQFLAIRMFLPNSLLVKETNKFKPTKQGISVLEDDIEIGDCQYWNYAWKPIHHRSQYASQCSLLRIRREAIQRPSLPVGQKLRYAFKLTKHTYNNSYGDLGTEVNHQLFPLVLPR